MYMYMENFKPRDSQGDTTQCNVNSAKTKSELPQAGLEHHTYIHFTNVQVYRQLHVCCNNSTCT